MRTLLLLICALFLAGCQREAQRYSFQHRTDGIYRYDHVAGEVHFLRAGVWQKVIDPALNSQRAD